MQGSVTIKSSYFVNIGIFSLDLLWYALPHTAFKSGNYSSWYMSRTVSCFCPRVRCKHIHVYEQHVFWWVFFFYVKVSLIYRIIFLVSWDLQQMKGKKISCNINIFHSRFKNIETTKNKHFPFHAWRIVFS